MSRITVSAAIELIPDDYIGYPDVSITLKCKQAERWKAELVRDALISSDCYDEEEKQ